mgnify:CR=1 FL=1
MGGSGVIDNFLGVFTSYIDSGFGLLGGNTDADAAFEFVQRGGQQAGELGALLVLVGVDGGGGQRDRGVPVGDQAALAADPVDPPGVGAAVDDLGRGEQVDAALPAVGHRVGLVGVGNCASSFVQGLSHYAEAVSNEAA